MCQTAPNSAITNQHPHATCRDFTVLFDIYIYIHISFFVYRHTHIQETTFSKLKQIHLKHFTIFRKRALRGTLLLSVGGGYHILTKCICKTGLWAWACKLPFGMFGYLIVLAPCGRSNHRSQLCIYSPYIYTYIYIDILIYMN